jgi:hypothetical protein
VEPRLFSWKIFNNLPFLLHKLFICGAKQMGYI